jgi:hypothetical protein
MLGQLGDELVRKGDLFPIHGPQEVCWHLIPDKSTDFIPQRFLLFCQQSVIKHDGLLSHPGGTFK